MKLNPFAQSNRGARGQAGVTLLEVILSLAVITTVTIGLNAISDRFSDDTQNSVGANQVRTFGEAAKSYIKDNYAAVQAVATPTAPALIDVPTLIAAGKLPAGYQAVNAFGQSTCALVLEPTANRLQAMVVTEGGTTLGDPSLGSIAAVVGGSGGGVYSTDTANIRGAVGGWAIPTSTFDNLVNNVNKRCDGTAGNVRVAAGHPAMALWFENGDTSSAFVARDALPGRPELNAMSTPLVMNSVQVVNAACTTSGAIAQDGAGGILSCQGGTWKSPGDGKCVSTTSDLNNLQTDGRCYNGFNLPNSPAGADWAFIEVYRHFVQTEYYVAQRVVGMTGTSVGKVWQRNQLSVTAAGGWTAWVQQADPGVSIASGNVTANGQISIGANNRLFGNGSQGSYGATTVAGSKNSWTGLEFRDAAGNYQINQMTNRGNVGYYDTQTGRWLNTSNTSGTMTLDQTADYASGRLNPGWAVETWGGCATGEIAKAAYTIADGWAYNGKTLACQNGVWTATKASLTQANCGWWAVPGGGNGAVGNFAVACPWGWYMAGYQNYRENDWTRTGYAAVLCCSA